MSASDASERTILPGRQKPAVVGGGRVLAGAGRQRFGRQRTMSPGVREVAAARRSPASCQLAMFQMALT